MSIPLTTCSKQVGLHLIHSRTVAIHLPRSMRGRAQLLHSKSLVYPDWPYMVQPHTRFHLVLLHSDNNTVNVVSRVHHETTVYRQSHGQHSQQWHITLNLLHYRVFNNKKQRTGGWGVGYYQQTCMVLKLSSAPSHLYLSSVSPTDKTSTAWSQWQKHRSSSSHWQAWSANLFRSRTARILIVQLQAENMSHACIYRNLNNHSMPKHTGTHTGTATACSQCVIFIIMMTQNLMTY